MTCPDCDLWGVCQWRSTADSRCHRPSLQTPIAYRVVPTFGELPPVKVRYWIEAVEVKRWWLFTKLVYYVASDFGHMGPYTAKEAEHTLAMMRRYG